MICGLTLRDRVSSMDFLGRCNLEDIPLTLRKRRMGWFGYEFTREGEFEVYVILKLREDDREADRRRVGRTVFVTS